MSTSETNSIYESISRAQAAIRSLSDVLGRPLPDALTYSDSPAARLLHDPDVCGEVAARLRLPRSGVGDDNLCRWLYDTFQSMDPDLQLTVLRFVPTIAGVYLSRAVERKPLPGFEAVLLALYAHETGARGGQPLTVSIPNLAHHPSLYHETTKSPTKNRAVELHMAVLSPALEPHGTVRATRRARLVGVALEMYCSKVALMPIISKIDFCEFCAAWAGRLRRQEPVEGSDGEAASAGEEEEGERGGRIPLPWELLQPTLRILSHCLMGPLESDELHEKAAEALRCLHARAMQDMMPQAILASRSLLRLQEMGSSSTSTLPDLSVVEDVRDPEKMAADAQPEMKPQNCYVCRKPSPERVRNPPQAERKMVKIPRSAEEGVGSPCR